MNEIESWVSDRKNLAKLKLMASKYVRGDEDKNDLVQETVLKMLKNMRKYNPGTNLGGWAYMILRNTFISRYHKDKVLDHFLIGNGEDGFDEEESMVVGVSFNGGESLVDKELFDEALNQVTPKYRECLQLHIAGFKYGEIADYVDKPMGTVKNRLFVGRAEFKEKIEKLLEIKKRRNL